MRDVKEFAQDWLSTLPERNAPRPALLSPDQSEGDVADIPFFPNLRARQERQWRAEEERRRQAEEQARKEEEERQRQASSQTPPVSQPSSASPKLVVEAILSGSARRISKLIS